MGASGLFAALAALAAATAAFAAEVTPTQKVIEMLTQMKAKGEKMMDEEKSSFAKYAEWVDDQSKTLAYEIKDAEAKIEELVAFITKAESDVAKLGREVAALEEEIRKLTQERAEATSERESENAEYLKVSTDYAESVDALKRAIAEVSAQDYDRDQAAALLQRMSSHMRGMPRVLAAFLQNSDSVNGAPAVAAYESQSGGVLELLESLLKKFKTELSEVESAETNQRHEFELVELHLKDAIEKDTVDMKEKVVARGKHEAAAARAKGELEKTKADKAADEALKTEIESTFRVKSGTFSENQKVRTAELEAIAKAVEIMSSPDVAEGYSKHIAAPTEPTAVAAPDAVASPSFLQLRGSRRRMAAGERVAELLGRRAQALNSASLAQLARDVSGSPFAKVIEMVEGLIAKLKQEAAEEADHKAWCDEQLKENKLKRNAKTAEAETLTAEITDLGAQIADMAAAIAKLAEEQEALTKAMSEATELRQSEKAENEQAITDAAAGVEAVQRALVVLKEFYSAQQASFIQQAQAPELESYKGMQGASGGVVGMLEVIHSDFSRLLHQTKASEEQAAKEYDVFMADSTEAKEQKHKKEFQLKLDKDQAEFQKSEDEKDLAAVQTELAKATEYFEQLKPSCLEVHVSFEERAAHREEEIQALKEAWGILDQKSSS